MNILGICGSPRKNGNNDLLLDECLSYAADRGAETEKIFLEGMDISPCKEEEYFKADENGHSIIKDDMEKVFAAVERADILIVASPVFFGSISAQLKIMIDRFQSVWVAKNVLNKNVFTKPKKGAFICVSAAGRNDFFENAGFVTRNFFATIGADCEDMLFVPGVEGKGAVASNRDVMAKARDLSEKLIKKFEAEKVQ